MVSEIRQPHYRKRTEESSGLRDEAASTLFLDEKLDQSLISIIPMEMVMR